MEKIPINYCSYRDLATVPGVGDALATTIVDLRSAHGDITPEMLMSVPGVRSMPDIMRMFDFKSYIPFSEGSHPVNLAFPKSRFRRVPQATASAPSQMSSFQDAWSGLQGGTQKLDPLMSRFLESPYPFDSYPPHPPSPYAYSAHPREAHRLREEVPPVPFGQDAAATWSGNTAVSRIKKYALCWRDGVSGYTT
ncbi:uncharacterized protein LOC119733705 [Patiria miniata]|uniref:Uncharacterized protein n=1 Tax=Patiria miniata TaxID=46514 RepID=A0A914AH47_PATMI|nr:uncharacterized protein LOC119733705 [Patiria miniata]